MALTELVFLIYHHIKLPYICTRTDPSRRYYNTLRFNKVINSISNQEELPQQWKEFILTYLFMKRVIKLTVVNIEGYHCYELHLGNACYYSVQNLLSSCPISKNLKIKIYRTVILPVVLYGCET
jgi:hypothetical protein